MAAAKGNKYSTGRPTGSKNEKTKQWENLADSITNEQAEKFNDYMNTLWNGNNQQKMIAADLYLKMLEYFKPKQARTEIKQEGVKQIEVVIKRKK
jgi:hypothetical protein